MANNKKQSQYALRASTQKVRQALQKKEASRKKRAKELVKLREARAERARLSEIELRKRQQQNIYRRYKTFLEDADNVFRDQHSVNYEKSNKDVLQDVDEWREEMEWENKRLCLEAKEAQKAADKLQKYIDALKVRRKGSPRGQGAAAAAAAAVVAAANKKKKKKTKKMVVYGLPASTSRRLKKLHEIDRVLVPLNNEGGLYCMTPYERMDERGCTVFKYGISLDLRKRVDSYHTYFPHGLYMLAFIKAPPLDKHVQEAIDKIKNADARKKEQRKEEKRLYMEIESTIKDLLTAREQKEAAAAAVVANKKANMKPLVHRIYSTTRVQKSNYKHEGETEWVYTSAEVMEDVFKEAARIHGYDDCLHVFPLYPKVVVSQGRGLEDKEYDMNELASMRERAKPNCISTIVFPLHGNYEHKAAAE